MSRIPDAINTSLACIIFWGPFLEGSVNSTVPTLNQIRGINAPDIAYKIIKNKKNNLFCFINTITTGNTILYDLGNGGMLSTPGSQLMLLPNRIMPLLEGVTRKKPAL